METSTIPNLDTEDIVHKLRAAYTAAHKSDDQSTKNGAILVNEGWNVIAGWNHMLDGYGDKPEHHERPFKYWVTEHAERSVILKAAAKGIQTKGLTMVANWVACPDCARAIVLSGIVAVVCHGGCQSRTPVRWKEQVEAGLKILKNGGVKLFVWHGDIGQCENLNNGEIWCP